MDAMRGGEIVGILLGPWASMHTTKLMECSKREISLVWEYELGVMLLALCKMKLCVWMLVQVFEAIFSSFMPSLITCLYLKK